LGFSFAILLSKKIRKSIYKAYRMLNIKF